MKKWLYRLAFLILLILLIPYMLIALYKLEFVHPVSTLMLGDVLSARSYKREWVNIDEIAPSVIQSVLMSEDGQYCAHSGVDWNEITRVAKDAFNGEASRGASTIAMQTAKNLFLLPVKSIIRKGLEIPLALSLNYIWGKKRVMEIYLNIAQWGHGIYGIEAAAQSYFGKSAKQLTRKQSAVLAAALPNPLLRSPAKPSSRMYKTARQIEMEARQSGAYIKCIYS